MENLATKYRPRTLEDITEQKVVVDIVKHMCESTELTNRNFLFIGPSGTGKTTTARIIGNILNEDRGEPIEVDAASHSGIDSVRELIDQMRMYPTGSKYKIFILDECFPGSTLARTPSGMVPIKDVKAGDQVYNLTGQATVSQVFENNVRTSHLLSLQLGNRQIVTTKNHLFFTDEGWVQACDLKEGDILYDYATMQSLWEELRDSVSEQSEMYAKHEVEVVVYCENDDSIILQTRPRLSKNADSDRGGWDRPQYEIAATARRKESELLKGIRVDSVEVYERGYNDRLFQSYFPDIDLHSSEFVTMYDIEVDGHPSYFVEDTLVHNCHAFSNNAWQALLKTLEEQPARTIVALCTTNPEKIPATILSRVQTFQLSKISLEGIYNRLTYIIEQENKEGRNITYDEDALMYLSKMAAGGMRDAITLLDKALMFDKNITIRSLETSLGLPNYDKYFDLLNAIAKKDNQQIVSIINAIYNSGVNFVKWFDGFFSFVTNIVKFIYLQDINQTMIPGIYQEKISKYGTAHSALCLKLSNKLVKMNQELKTTQYLQELAISYLCTAPVIKKG